MCRKVLDLCASDSSSLHSRYTGSISVIPARPPSFRTFQNAGFGHNRLRLKPAPLMPLRNSAARSLTCSLTRSPPSRQMIMVVFRHCRRRSMFHIRRVCSAALARNKLFYGADADCRKAIAGLAAWWFLSAPPCSSVYAISYDGPLLHPGSTLRSAETLTARCPKRSNPRRRQYRRRGCWKAGLLKPAVVVLLIIRLRSSPPMVPYQSPIRARRCD